MILLSFKVYSYIYTGYHSLSICLPLQSKRRNLFKSLYDRGGVPLPNNPKYVFFFVCLFSSLIVLLHCINLYINIYLYNSVHVYWYIPILYVPFSKVKMIGDDLVTLKGSPFLSHKHFLFFIVRLSLFFLIKLLCECLRCVGGICSQMSVTFLLWQLAGTLYHLDFFYFIL